jgi:hypothetical protein
MIPTDLTNIKVNEIVVEMNDCEVHFYNNTSADTIKVVEVTLYKCVQKRKSIFHKYEKELEVYYKYPFYFLTRELANEFISMMDILKITTGSYTHKNEKTDEWEYPSCYMVATNFDNGESAKYYWMVDHIKQLYLPCPKNSIKSKESYLKKNGVWGGVVNTNAQYGGVFEGWNIDYRDILNTNTYVKKLGNSTFYKLEKI